MVTSSVVDLPTRAYTTTGRLWEAILLSVSLLCSERFVDTDNALTLVTQGAGDRLQ